MTFPGCWRDPFAGFYTRSRPATTDVAGAYTAADGTTLLLRDDGTFSLTNASVQWVDDERAKPRRVSADGRWSVSKHQEWWDLELNFDRVDGAPSKGYGSRPVALLGEKPPYELRLVLGDPDEGKGVSLKRSSAATRSVTQSY